MHTQKIRVKIGPHEFESEGPSEEVSAQFKAWKELILAMNTQATPTQLQTPVKPSPRSSDPEVRKPLDHELEFMDIFEADEKRNLVTLKVHPRGDSRDADALLLIVYAYRQMGTEEVMVMQLKESLQVSGLRIDRIDRAATGYVESGYLLKSGRAKGSKYRITNTGYAKADEMAKALFAMMA